MYPVYLLLGISTTSIFSSICYSLRPSTIATSIYYRPPLPSHIVLYYHHLLLASTAITVSYVISEPAAFSPSGTS
ncbi:hypothetical protein V8C42DRAFT_71798 [Trichoderma barbatum]